MNKSKIEWLDGGYTWNPVTGCLHNCEYCYARKQARRFSGCYDMNSDENIIQSEKGKVSLEHNGQVLFKTKKNKLMRAPYPFGFVPTFHRYRLDEPQGIKKPQNVFVCSMADLFGEWVPDWWIKQVFEATQKAPQHNYIYLTKNPDFYYRLNDGDEKIIPDGGVSGFFGASASTEGQAQSAYENLNCQWISIEPIQGEFSEEFFWYEDRYIQDCMPRWKWVIIGAETGNRKGKVIPKREWIENIVSECREQNVPVFLKDSLIDIVGEKQMVREFPWQRGEIKDK